nr:protein giant-like [Onthophagus taurus]
MKEPEDSILDLSISKYTPKNKATINEESSLQQPSSSTNDISPSIISSKLTRPFKAYKKDSFSITSASSLAIYLGSVYSSQEYVEFRKGMMGEAQMNYTNKNMKRNNHSKNGSGDDDPIYLEKRRKNNEAAKRSRDARRAKEDEIAIRCAFLEQQNWKLSCEVNDLKKELLKLKC